MKTKTTHTPGPWKAGTGWVMPSNGQAGRPICMRDSTVVTIDEDAANLRLIAAAPDLLRLLKENLVALKQNIEDIGGCDHPVNICCCDLVHLADDTQSAIEKAEGQEVS